MGIHFHAACLLGILAAYARYPSCTWVEAQTSVPSAAAAADAHAAAAADAHAHAVAAADAHAHAAAAAHTSASACACVAAHVAAPSSNH